MKLEDILKEQIDDAIFLGKIGIKEYIWDYQQIMNVFDFLKEKEITILGGDVYIKNNCTYSQTGDSWFYEAEVYDYMESYKKARQYVELISKDNHNLFFSVVI